MKRVYENYPEPTNNARARHRDGIELLRSRLHLLDGMDKLLMTMFIEHCNSVRQIARMRGVCEATIDRRIRVISKRLLVGLYFDCLRNRYRLTRRQFAVAKDYYLLGLSMRQIAAKKCCSYYSVRETVIEIRSILAVGFWG